MCNAFFLSEEARYFFLKKGCVDFDFISLIHYYYYKHIAHCYQEFYLQDSCYNLTVLHSVQYSENYYQLFKH